jgi:hypothetical protein
MSLAEQFRLNGYSEICDEFHGRDTYDSLYACFDELVEFLRNNPVWAQKLYCAKERFIRTKERQHYSSDFFGLYDELERAGRHQISFYYASHFHDYICNCYPEFNQIPEITRFLEACFVIQKSYGGVFKEAAMELGVESIFTSLDGEPPILFKVVKYYPSYVAKRPHYDGTAFSLFLDSTDNQSLFLSPYKNLFTVEDFFSPLRTYPRENRRNSILLIPGTLLTEFSIDPTPHIVLQNGKIRYATIAFAMRPNFIPRKNEFSILPDFQAKQLQH